MTWLLEWFCSHKRRHPLQLLEGQRYTHVGSAWKSPRESGEGGRNPVDFLNSSILSPRWLYSFWNYAGEETVGGVSERRNQWRQPQGWKWVSPFRWRIATSTANEADSAQQNTSERHPQRIVKLELPFPLPLPPDESNLPQIQFFIQRNALIISYRELLRFQCLVYMFILDSHNLWNLKFHQ